MSIKVALDRLGYTQEWLEYGVISEDYLISQYDEISSSEDKNAEHYRYRGFADYLKRQSSLSNQEVENIFKLKDNGPDNCDLHDNRIIELIYSEILSDEQYEKLAAHSEVLERPIQKVYLRFRLIKKIKKHGIDNAFDQVAKTEDTYVHRFVLELPDVKREHVRWLSENGGNKKVRNIAKAMMNSRTFRGNA